ncbi:DUF3592 domain-containing protein [Actinoplanes teichomyceticus]|uniref:Uncharacterized protein DUF3592 n=1 Tax=Actinoplanes teichomyceticus TaxID=1867 RepID=A0A561WA61_ACTTI|nr:DUF3592 domain-containing protein [Actinoplanes teichomyceticus]TWG20748.1 uncharacterized protein DUF3592 [Actinoplanes teichomyceticus]GIF14404.1 hypothetical protein Ate01nite_44360 [Actinoplanes teichomyceticus]
MIEAGVPVFALLVAAFLVLVPAGVGITMIAAGLRRWNHVRRLTATGERATATVVDNQMEAHRHGLMRFLPVVTFVTRTGREIRTVLTDQSSNRSHLPGSQQTVAFDPERPDQAVSTTGQAPGTVSAVIMGAIFLLFAGVALFLTSLIFLSPGSPLTDLP